jgi:hypothetical protein
MSSDGRNDCMSAALLFHVTDTLMMLARISEYDSDGSRVVGGGVTVKDAPAYVAVVQVVWLEFSNTYDAPVLAVPDPSSVHDVAPDVIVDPIGASTGA